MYANHTRELCFITDHVCRYLGAAGANYGWPQCEGTCGNPDFPTCDCGVVTNPMYAVLNSDCTMTFASTRGMAKTHACSHTLAETLINRQTYGQINTQTSTDKGPHELHTTRTTYSHIHSLTHVRSRFCHGTKQIHVSARFASLHHRRRGTSNQWVACTVLRRLLLC